MAENITPPPNTFGQRFNQTLEQSLNGFRQGRNPSALGTVNVATDKALNYKAYIVAQEYKSEEGQGILVEGWLPETVGLDVNADYEAPFAQGLTGVMPQGLGNLARYLGLSMTTQAFTAQVWQGGSFINFQVPFVFQSEASGADDVMKPIKDLLRLMMPLDPQNGGLLRAPGPVINPTKLAKGGVDALKSIAGAVANTDVSLQSLTNTASQVVNNPSAFVTSAEEKAGQIARPLSSAIVNSIENNISLYLGRFLYFPSVVITDVSPTYDVMIGPDRNPVRATVNVSFRTFYVPTQNDINIMFPSTTAVVRNT